jgi:pyruvate dehydrogenase E1 component beta subunit
MDFALLAIDSIVNAAAKWRYSLDQRTPLPLTIRVIINRGGEQGAQHSQALHSWFAHIPGLKVVMPSSARDAYYMLRASIQSKDPVIFVEDRWDYEEEAEFELHAEIPSLNLAKPEVVNVGSLVTVVGIGHTTNITRRVVSKLSGASELVEVIDLRVVQPLDPSVIIESVRKTKRLVVVDGSWKNAGMAGEVIASVMESLDIQMMAPPIRITLPDAPAPTSKVLEQEYYRQEIKLEEVLTKFIDSYSLGKDRVNNPGNMKFLS